MEQAIVQSGQKTRFKAYLVLLVSSTLYAGNVIAGKLISHDVPPAALSAVRGVLGLLVLLPLTWPVLKNSPRPTKKEMIQLLALGFFGITFAYLSFIVGIKYASGTNASIIAATLPAMTNTLLVIGYKTKLHKLQVYGLVTSFIGLMIVFSQGSLWHLFTLNLGIGDLILLSNVLSMAVFNVLGQSIMRRLSAVVTCVYALAFGTALLIFPGVWQMVSSPWQINLSGWLIIIYMGCVVTGFAFFLNLYAIDLIGSGRASIFNNLQPVISIILSVIILGESLAIYHWIGFLLVISGIVLSLVKPGELSGKQCPNPKENPACTTILSCGQYRRGRNYR